MTDAFLSILEISASVSLVVLVLLLLGPFLNKRYASKWKCWIWLFLALRLLFPVSNLRLISDTFSDMFLRSAKEAEKSGTELTDAGNVPSGRLVLQIPEQMTKPMPIRMTFLDLAAFIWMAGCLGFLSVHLLSYLHWKHRIVKEGSCTEDSGIQSIFLELKEELQIRRAVPVIVFHAAPSPMIMGFWRSFLVLPQEQYSQEELFFILKHELMHLKHRDANKKLLFIIANAVHWFNPIIWVMKKEAAMDLELSCDECVVQGSGQTVRKAYTETLLAALHKQCTKRNILSAQFYGGKQVMKKRFQNILNQTKKKNGTVLLLGMIVLTSVLGSAAGCSVSGQTEVKQEEDLFSKMSGQWRIDFDTESDISGDHIDADNSEEDDSNADTSDADSLNAGLKDAQKDNSNENSASFMTTDQQEISRIVQEFADSFFSGDSENIRKYLANSYDDAIITYEGNGTVSDFTVKGLDTIDEDLARNGIANISLEYRDSSNPDTFWYLTFAFVRQADTWKIMWYGLEG